MAENGKKGKRKQSDSHRIDSGVLDRIVAAQIDFCDLSGNERFDSKELFGFLVDTMVQGLIIQDVESKIIIANNAACKILGLTMDQLLGKTTLDSRWKLIHEDGSPLPPEEMPSNVVLRTGQPVTDVLIGTFIPEQDIHHWILTSSIPKFKQGESKPFITLTTFTDITGRKQAEESHYQSQQMFRTLVENSQDIIARYDRNCQRIYVNPVYLRESGIPKDELLSSSPLQRSPLPIQSAQELQNLLQKVLDSGKEDSADILWPREDNADHWFNVHASPEFDREGKVMSVMTISRDITSRKQAEQVRINHLKFLEHLDIINRIIQTSNNLEQMMTDVLDKVLEIFESDRVFLMYPCDPEATEWKSPMERTKKGYPGVLEQGINMPMDPAVAETLRILLRADGPVQFGPGTAYPLPAEVSVQFGFKSFMSMALYPKVGIPWQFGIHQCSSEHIWAVEEEQLFREIGNRLSDALGSLLSFRELQQSEQRFRMVFENSPVSIWEEDFSDIRTFFERLRKERITDIDAYFNKYPETVVRCTGLVKIIDVNQSALILHDARNKQELMGSLINTFTPESFDTFRSELICLWNGETEMACDTIVKTLQGEIRNVAFYFTVSPGYEKSLSKVLISLIDITERKLAEEALLINEERYQKAQAIGHVGNWEYNLQTSNFWGSDEAKRIYGFDPLQDNFTTDEVENCIPERERVHQALIDLIENGKSYNMEFEIHPLNTTESKIITSIAEVIHDKYGKPFRVVGVIQDITNRKKADEALKDTARHLKEAQQLAHIGNWELDVINNVLTWSDEIYRIFEIDSEKFGATYEAFLDAIHPDDRESVNFAYTNSLQTKTLYALDHRLLFSDGRIKYVHERCETFYEGDKAVRSIGTVQDITQRKLAEIKILASEQLFRALVENSPDFIARYDLEFRRIYVNPSIQKLFKNSEKEVIGKTPTENTPLYAPQIYINHLQQVIETASESTAEIPYRTEQGEMHWGHMRFVPEFNQGGKVASVLAIGRDIHEIKENEKRFRMLAENFPDFVVRFNSDYRYIYINPAVEKAFGMPYESFIGKTIKELPLRGKPDQNDANMTLIRRAFTEGETNGMEVLWHTQLGERMFELRHIPEKDATGNVISVLGIARDITERKRAEEKILRSEQRLRLHLEESPLGFLEWDDNFRAVEWNAACEKIFGYTREEAIGRYAKDLILPVEVRELVDGIFHSLMSQTGGQYSINENITRDGRIIICEWFNTTLINKEGKAIGIASICRDITNQKQMEDELSRYREHLEELVKERTLALEEARNKAQLYLDIAGVILVAIDSQQRITMINQKGCEVLGGDYKEIIGKGWFDTFVPEKYRREVVLGFNKLMAGDTEQVEYFENPVVTKNGKERLIAWHNVLLRDEKGKIIGTLSSGEDITESRRLENALLKSEFILKKAQELGKIGGWDWDATTGIVAWTEQLYDLHEMPFDIPDAQRMEKSNLCYRPEDKQLFDEVFLQCIEKGTSFELELPFVGLKSTKKWVQIGAAPYFEEGKIKHVYGYTMDITERKNTEEQISNLNKDLQSRAMALEAANKELEAFAYSVSHDLRAPLRHIDGFIELLVDQTTGLLDEKSLKYMSNISHASTRMGKLIDDLLSFSRMARHEMSTLQVDFNVLVREVIQDFEPDLANRQIEWKIADLPKVTGDRSLLRVVMVNLISNAIKFTRLCEHPIIEIGFIKQEEEKIFYIRDNGVGFDQEYSGKLFGVFQRLHRTDEFEGTGIGLANVRRIIARHGGTTWAEGNVDKGATFYFSLKL